TFFFHRDCGVSTISIEREFEVNDSKAGSLSGNFFVKMRFISSTFCSQITAWYETSGTRYNLHKIHRNRKMAVWMKGFEKQGSGYTIQ
ncbi:MAG: hypothetical protein AB7D24_12510, partial [Sphaerochaeta sp.]|uniref:hypothetical protein n=1 Tax=Sphaerochaeta sp. TaxID=1972642 RepID=UPI003D132A4A